MHVRRHVHDGCTAATLPYGNSRQAYSRVPWASGGCLPAEEKLDDDVIIVDVQGPSTKCTAGKRLNSVDVIVISDSDSDSDVIIMSSEDGHDRRGRRRWRNHRDAQHRKVKVHRHKFPVLSSLTREPLRSCSPTSASSSAEHPINQSPRREEHPNSLSCHSPSHTPLVPTSPHDTKPTSFPSMHCKPTHGVGSSPPFQQRTPPSPPPPLHSESLLFNTTGDTFKIRRPRVKAEHTGRERTSPSPVNTENPKDRERTDRYLVSAEHLPDRDRPSRPPVHRDSLPPVKAEQLDRDHRPTLDGVSVIRTHVRPHVHAPAVKSMDSTSGDRLVSPNRDHDKGHKHSPRVPKASHTTGFSPPSFKPSHPSFPRTSPCGSPPGFEGSVPEPKLRATRSFPTLSSISELRPDHSSSDTATPAHHNQDDQPLTSPVRSPKTYRQRKRSISFSSPSESKHRHADTSTRVDSNHHVSHDPVSHSPHKSNRKHNRKRHRRHSEKSSPGLSKKKRRHSSSEFSQSPSFSPYKRWKVSDFFLTSPRNLADLVLPEQPEDSHPNSHMPACGSPVSHDQCTSVPHLTPSPQVMSGSYSSSPRSIYSHSKKDALVKCRDNEDGSSSLPGSQEHLNTEDSGSLLQGSGHSPLARCQTKSRIKRSRHCTEQLSPKSPHKKKRQRFNSDCHTYSSRILDFFHPLSNHQDSGVHTGPDHTLGSNISRNNAHPASTVSDPPLSHQCSSSPSLGQSYVSMLSPGRFSTGSALLPPLSSPVHLHESSVSSVHHLQNHVATPSSVSRPRVPSPPHSSVAASFSHSSTSPNPSLPEILSPHKYSDPHSYPLTSVEPSLPPTPSLPASVTIPGPLPSLDSLPRESSLCVPSPPSSPNVNSPVHVPPHGGSLTSATPPVNSKGKAPLGTSVSAQRKKCLKLLKSPSSPRFTNSPKSLSGIVKVEPKPLPHLDEEEQSTQAALSAVKEEKVNPEPSQDDRPSDTTDTTAASIIPWDLYSDISSSSSLSSVKNGTQTNWNNEFSTQVESSPSRSNSVPASMEAFPLSPSLPCSGRESPTLSSLATAVCSTREHNIAEEEASPFLPPMPTLPLTSESISPSRSSACTMRLQDTQTREHEVADLSSLPSIPPPIPHPLSPILASPPPEINPTCEHEQTEALLLPPLSPLHPTPSPSGSPPQRLVTPEMTHEEAVLFDQASDITAKPLRDPSQSAMIANAPVQVGLPLCNAPPCIETVVQPFPRNYWGYLSTYADNLGKNVESTQNYLKLMDHLVNHGCFIPSDQVKTYMMRTFRLTREADVHWMHQILQLDLTMRNDIHVSGKEVWSVLERCMQRLQPNSAFPTATPSRQTPELTCLSSKVVLLYLFGLMAKDLNFKVTGHEASLVERVLSLNDKWRNVRKLLDLLFATLDEDKGRLDVDGLDLLEVLASATCLPLLTCAPFSRCDLTTKLAREVSLKLARVSTIAKRQALILALPSDYLREQVIALYLESNYHRDHSSGNTDATTNGQGITLARIGSAHLSRTPYTPTGEKADLAFFLFLLCHLLGSHLRCIRGEPLVSFLNTLPPSPPLPPEWRSYPHLVPETDIQAELQSLGLAVVSLMNRLMQEDSLLGELTQPRCWVHLQILQALT